MTVDFWGVLAVVAPLVVMLFRELITDRACDGGVIEIVVDRRARD